MDTKSWWQSKTVWTAIVTAILGAVQPVSTAVGHPIDVPAWLFQALAGVGLYSLRDGMNKPLQ